MNQVIWNEGNTQYHRVSEVWNVHKFICAIKGLLLNDTHQKKTWQMEKMSLTEQWKCKSQLLSFMWLNLIMHKIQIPI